MYETRVSIISITVHTEQITHVYNNLT